MQWHIYIYNIIEIRNVLGFGFELLTYHDILHIFFSSANEGAQPDQKIKNQIWNTGGC